MARSMRAIVVNLSLIVSTVLAIEISGSNVTSKRTIEDAYYYDYEFRVGGAAVADGSPKPDAANVTQSATIAKWDYGDEGDNPEIVPDALILPSPEVDAANADDADILPEVELPDDSLADSDLKDHDFIDNLMYVYYGSGGAHGAGANSVHYHRGGLGGGGAGSRRALGTEIMVIGSVLSCAAQLLTIFTVLLRRNSSSGKRENNAKLLHTVICLCATNLLFMIGVHATRNAIKCQIIALLLHYAHLLSATWIFMYGYYVYRKYCHSEMTKDGLLVTLTYTLPGILTLLSFSMAPHSYETKLFCFLSVERGMIFHYMLPVSTLIIATTVYCLNGIRKINMELAKLELSSSSESLNVLKYELEQQHAANEAGIADDSEVTTLRDGKRCLKAVCVWQMSYGVVWFVAVLALEINGNGDGEYMMATIYSILSVLMNWYIFGRSRTFQPTMVGRYGMRGNSQRVFLNPYLMSTTSPVPFHHSVVGIEVVAGGTQSADTLPTPPCAGDSIPLLIGNGILIPPLTATMTDDAIMSDVSLRSNEYISTISS